MKWNGRGKAAIWRFLPVRNKIHPTQKSIPLFKKLINQFVPLRQNTVILDPFLGSGTTAVACEQLGIRWIGIEIKEEYCEIAANRVEKEIRSKSNDHGIRKFIV